MTDHETHTDVDRAVTEHCPDCEDARAIQHAEGHHASDQRGYAAVCLDCAEAEAARSGDGDGDDC